MKKIGKLAFVAMFYVIFLVYYFVKSIFVGEGTKQTVVYSDQ